MKIMKNLFIIVAVKVSKTSPRSVRWLLKSIKNLQLFRRYTFSLKDNGLGVGKKGSYLTLICKVVFITIIRLPGSSHLFVCVCTLSPPRIAWIDRYHTTSRRRPNAYRIGCCCAEMPWTCKVCGKRISTRAH